MIPFERHLLNIGYKKYRYKDDVWSLEKKNHHHISSIDNVQYRYVKNDNNIDFYVGLHEYKKPPTLIYPRPKLKIDNKNYIKYPDDFMNRILMKYSPTYILHCIVNNLTITL